MTAQVRQLHPLIFRTLRYYLINAQVKKVGKALLEGIEFLKADWSFRREKTQQVIKWIEWFLLSEQKLERDRRVPVWAGMHLQLISLQDFMQQHTI